MEYELTAEEAGKYEVIMCMANGYPEIQNCFTVAVNGQQQPGISFNAQQTGDGNGASEWYNFEECEPFYINLDKGVNLVRFTANKNNPNYDYILFRRVGDQEELYNKVIKAEGAKKIEAEKYDAAAVFADSDKNVYMNKKAKNMFTLTKDGYTIVE